MKQFSLMRKVTAVALATALILSLTGCAGNSSVSGSESQTSAEAEPENDWEIDNVPILRDCVRQKLGGFAGCAVTGSEIDDPKVWEIMTTHFEAVTLGNELKPDALFNYSVTNCPGTETVLFNGEDMVVPVLNYQRAEKILNKIYDWNAEHPDRKIKVRGHVLVWHSQTPEWFFHENYDKNEPYVDEATMDKRLEWYIRTVLEHFTGEDSKYRDMFYGWDVVNEAISDGTGTIRSDGENLNEKLSEDRHGSNSSWFHIYQSNRFIINAFKFANKYAPADLELYYNDYNECQMNKRNGIIQLLKDIKAEEGAPGEGTRISAMGMQGHYGMDSPDFGAISSSIKMYCEVVGKVQLTEIDVSASSDYDGSKDKKADEYEKLRKRYQNIYFAITGANETEGVEVSGITFWGTADHLSWLQHRSNVGGGSKSGLPQCPLLFDENYKPKSCFFVFTKTD
ncbi:MAG: endo-1,4-beta-xylanase [Lachnospiraceae bacterium]|nr:endo-1,4-beta-xylanase [Lachnospiraceae bacterium]